MIMQYDKDFLLRLDKNKNKTIYARITALTFEESPVETIEGRITQGSINIDGASAVRRTCSLTMVSQNFNYHDYYWGLNTKFKMKIGVENNIDPDYPDIIWFKQGIFIITSFNTSRSINNFTISLQGKDKMCLLNGEVSGNLESSVDFGTVEEEDKNGNWTIRKIAIPKIIRNAVHQYGKEPYHNIVIKDLDTIGLELLEYRYDTPMYLYRQVDRNVYDNATLDGSKKCTVNGITKTLDELNNNELETLVVSLIGSDNPPKINIDGSNFYVAKVSYGQTAGYRTTELVYAGDLIANIGDSLTSILDKIKNMLGEFEYFYDIDGRFIFQKKRSFINTLWKSMENEEDEQEYVESLALASTTLYEFRQGELISAFNNNPNLLNLRNDFSIWGVRTSVNGAEIPVHMRYAIDRKPVAYTTITVSNAELENYNKKYGTNLKGQKSVSYFASDSDWREIIYKMALDFFKYNHLDDFEIKVGKANPSLYPTGRTGYEQYYTDIQGFWRELYNPELSNTSEEELQKAVRDAELALKNFGQTNIAPDPQMRKDFNRWSQLNEKENLTDEEAAEYDDLANKILDYNSKYQDLENQLTTAQYNLAHYINKDNFYTDPKDSDKLYWAKAVYETPESLNFWFDFLDSEGDLAQFSVKNIGSRSKSLNDTNIKSIYFRETPKIVFGNSDDTVEGASGLTGYRFIQVPNIEAMFSISAQGKSAKDKLDELLYQHGYCTESATITTIPIYYLEPNNRIYLFDEDTGLNGDYVLSKISISLAYNGTMSLTATKAAESII